MSALRSMPIVSYCSAERHALIHFRYAQQDQKRYGIGITHT